MQDRINAQREKLSEIIKELQDLSKDRPANGAELTLALRHVQEARMWLGVARGMADGQDPWGVK